MLKKIRLKLSRMIKKTKGKVKLYSYHHFVVGKTQVDKKLILFESMLGRNYSGNPRGIYEEILRRGLDEKYKIVWILKDTSVEIPGNCKKINRGTFRYLKLLSKAGMWVFDTRQANYIVKSPETIQIMTWHGTPLKKLALDMDDIQMAGNKGIENYKARFWNNTRRWDYLIAQNKYSQKIFKKCFDFNKPILTIGYPRNDTLINNNNKEYINGLKEKYNLPMDKKIILYAPTWRDGEGKKRGKYKFNPHINFDYLKQNIKKDYIIIVKYHYLISDNIDWKRFKGFIYDLKVDIQELYLMSDILITDYSSVMFDYSVLKRPMIFYTYDLEEYYDSRGVYFDFKDKAPGPFVSNYTELVELLKSNYDYSIYDEKYKAWYKKFNALENGKSGSVIVDLIEENLDNETK